jgi:hypothetical protein
MGDRHDRVDLVHARRRSWISWLSNMASLLKVSFYSILLPF